MVCAVGLAACGTTETVALRLSADPACDSTHFSAIKTLSIEAFAQAGACKIAHSCVFNIDAQDEFDLEDALRSAGDVLLELDPAEVQTISVNGRPRNDCFPRQDDSNEPTVCGSANLTASTTAKGQLDVLLQCENLDDNLCIESLDLCP